MRKFSLLTMLLMPHASSGSQDGTIDGNRSHAHGPGLDQVEQMPTQAANLCRQDGWHGFEAPFPRTTRWKTALLAVYLAQSPHFCGWLGQDTAQFMHIV
jgi:hypothetical protein